MNKIAINFDRNCASTGRKSETCMRSGSVGLKDLVSCDWALTLSIAKCAHGESMPSACNRDIVGLGETCQ